MDPLEPTSLVLLNRVLDRRHNEAASAWTLHLVLHVPLLYVAGLSCFGLCFVHHRTTVRPQPFAQRSRATCSRPLGDASNHASREELRPFDIVQTSAMDAPSSAVERLGSFPTIFAQIQTHIRRIVTHDIHPCTRSLTIVASNRRSSYP